MRPLDDIQATVTAIRAGNRRILARAITHIENETPDAIKLLDALYPHVLSVTIILGLLAIVTLPHLIA